MAKPILISGVQPTGRMHIGNYLGALKNFVELQNSGKYECYFFIADLHSLTLDDFDPKKKHSQILELAADYLALGLDPKKSVLFQQSQIPAHSELAWIISTITPLGELERMTQFKEKARVKGLGEILEEDLGREDWTHQIQRGSKKYPKIRDFKGDSPRVLANTGLFTYPVLMAADIILYDAKVVPVGEDQVQHLELTRTLARKFNKKFGQTFIEPQPLLTPTSRVMSLQNPEKKMSKSQPESCLFLDDEPGEVRQKVKRAVTDSGSEVKYDLKGKKAVSNLLSIYSALTDEAIPQLEKKYRGKNYSVFKSDLAEAIVEHLAPYRAAKKKFISKPKTLTDVLNAASKKAGAKAEKKIAEVKQKTGLIV